MKIFFKSFSILETRKLPESCKVAWGWLGKLRLWQKTQTDGVCHQRSNSQCIPRPEIFLSTDEMKPRLQIQGSGLANASVTQRAASPQCQLPA